MNSVLRYSVLRFLVFFGVLGVLYLVGMRGFLLLIVAALISTAVSYIGLANFRQDTVVAVQKRVDERSERAKKLREAEDDDVDDEE